MKTWAATTWAAAVAAVAWCGAAVGDEPSAGGPALAPSPRIAMAFDEAMPAPPIAETTTAGLFTIGDAESLALSRYPALRQAEGLVRAARGNWVQVGLRPNPTIGYQAEEIGEEGTAGMQGGYFSQQFITAGKLGLNRAVAARELAAAEQRFEFTRLQLLTTVRLYYIEAQAAERAAALANQLDAIATQSVTVSEKLLGALQISRASLLQIQIERDSAALLKEQATNRRDAAWRRLASLVGMENEPAKLLEDTLLRPLPEVDWESARVRVLTESPELSELRFDVEAARWAVGRARAGRVPDVSTMAGVMQDNSSGYTIANVQIGVPIPIFDRNQGAITEACGELLAAQAALEQRELSLQQRLAAALRDYATARQWVMRYSDSIVPTSRESLEIITRAYEQGEIDFLQLLAIQRTFAEKNLAYLQALETAWKKWAEIDGLLVGPLPEGAN